MRDVSISSSLDLSTPIHRCFESLSTNRVCLSVSVTDSSCHFNRTPPFVIVCHRREKPPLLFVLAAEELHPLCLSLENCSWGGGLFGLLHFTGERRGRWSQGGNKKKKWVERMSVWMWDSQDLIPSMWMISNLEKRSTPSHRGAAVRNQRDQPAIVRIIFGSGKLLLRFITGASLNYE